MRTCSVEQKELYDAAYRTIVFYDVHMSQRHEGAVRCAADTLWRLGLNLISGHSGGKTSYRPPAHDTTTLYRMRCTARKAFPTGADLKPALRTGVLQCRLKERCRSRDALKNTMCIRRTPFFSARSAVTRACLRLRGGAAVSATERGWCLARASARAGVRSSMFC